MDSKSLSCLTSKARLEEIRNKLESRSGKAKKTQIDEFRESIFSSFRTSPPRIHAKKVETVNNKSHPMSPSRVISPNLNHYNSIASFRNKQPIINTKIKKANDYASLIHSKSPIFGSSENVSDLITIGTLSTAIGIVTKGGLDDLPRAYIRQLKQFCNEALANLNN